MKKTLAIALAALALTACSKPNPTDEVVKVMDEATAKIEKAKSVEEVQQIGEEMGDKMTKLQEEYPDYEPNAEEQQRIQEASLKMMQASAKLFKQSVPDALQNPAVSNTSETPAAAAPAAETGSEEAPAE